MQPDPQPDADVLVFNLKRRYTGVSATVNALLPEQRRRWRLAYCGTPLPNRVPSVSMLEALRLSRRPAPGRRCRVWHVRRDHEMLFGLWARDVLRLPVRLVFTSAAQRQHGVVPRWLISRMDAVIATSGPAAACVPGARAVVPHGIDTARFPQVDKSKAWADSGLSGRWGLGVFGRVRPDKGTDLFVHSLLEVLPRHPEWTAVIAGWVAPAHRAWAAELQARIDAAGLNGRIVFLGEVPPSEVAHWYQRCLLCVACPREEPFGLTPFEAASTGCALLCSRTGAFESLVREGIDGRLVAPGDAAALASALDDLLPDPGRLMRWGEAAAERVRQRHSLAAEADGIDGVYRALLEVGT
jgi:mannosyltransferase